MGVKRIGPSPQEGLLDCQDLFNQAEAIFFEPIYRPMIKRKGENSLIKYPWARGLNTVCPGERPVRRFAQHLLPRG
jgi:hypothetical protein